ncbi:MAG: NAD(P)/FAD-dependent oxidoreductase [Bacteroidota bacterium]
MDKKNRTFDRRACAISFYIQSSGNAITQLMGVSVEKAIVKITRSKLIEEGPVLITHWGLSGPVILRLSAWGARSWPLVIGSLQFILTGFLL